MTVAIKESWKQPNGKYACPYCSQMFDKEGIALHIWRSHTRAGKKHSHCTKKRRKYRRIHSGWYRGYWCDSGWELAFLLYHFDQGHEVKRNEKGYPYMYRGKLHFYYPDFILQSGFVEIKGLMNAKNRAKLAAFPYKILVIEEKDMKPILAYVYGKYGKDYHRLLCESKRDSMK